MVVGGGSVVVVGGAVVDVGTADVVVGDCVVELDRGVVVDDVLVSPGETDVVVVGGSTVADELGKVGSVTSGDPVDATDEVDTWSLLVPVVSGTCELAAARLVGATGTPGWVTSWRTTATA